MKKLPVVLALVVGLLHQPVMAAFQAMPVQTRTCIVDNGLRRYEVTQPSSTFLVQVLGDNDGAKTETYRDGHAWVAAHRGERYAVRLYNPLPVRVAVNLTVDGINSITGKPSGIQDGDKWIIEANSFITIRGWQVNGEESRRFFFTDKRKSYAKWRGHMLKKDLAANCGVIGAAYFWNQSELDAYYESHPQYIDTGYPYSRGGFIQDRAQAPGIRAAEVFESQGSSGAPVTPQRKEKAGTGMGERESHPTQTVNFEFDRGMYELSQAVVIYYDFADEPTPNPFPGLSYAPEMP